MSEHEQYEDDPLAGPIVHVYDGIREADSKLPRWWLLTFYGSIIFAGLYWFYYEEYEIGLEPLAAYQSEAAAAAASTGAPLTNEQLAGMAANPGAVTAGQRIFTQNCVVCHGDHAEGKIGPNLTDDFWINGGHPTDVWRIVRDGVAAKGMPAWGSILGALPAQQVTAYVLSVRGTNVTGKAAEGERYAP